MGNTDECVNKHHRVQTPPPKPFFQTLKSSLKETFFPDDPFKQFKNQPTSRKFMVGLRYFVPIFEWAPRYTFEYFRADVIAGITIASLAVPQGISYAGLASLPPVIGLYSSFVPPLIYAMMGTSRDLAVGTVAVPSLLLRTMLGKEVIPRENTMLYVLTATFFAGVFQAALGILRLGFIVDFLSHATIVGFMAGAASVVCLQQLKGILGLVHFTHNSDLVSVIKSVFKQLHMWRWQSGVLGCGFLFALFTTRYFVSHTSRILTEIHMQMMMCNESKIACKLHRAKENPVFFWINALAPLASVIMGTLLVYLTHAEEHGVEIIGHLKRGLNPSSLSELEVTFGSKHLIIAIKTGIITGIIALAEGIAVGRSFALFKGYQIDGNKEMIAIGIMNIAGSCTSCYLTTGPFARTAVNFHAGCKTLVSNIVMSTAVMITLLFLTPLFYYTPLVVLSAIIITAMISVIDYKAAQHKWKVDKFDFVVCMSAFVGVIFGSIQTGLVIAVVISLIRVLLFVARPRTSVMGNITNSTAYRSIGDYPEANLVPGFLILQINAPIFFTNAGYLRERILRWIEEEEDKVKGSTKPDLQFVVLDMTAVGSIDTSGIGMLREVKKNLERMGIKLVLANPGEEVMKKMDKSDFIADAEQDWIFLTVAEAVDACNTMLRFETKQLESKMVSDKV